MNHKQIIRVIIFPLLLLLWGCQESSFDFQVRYADILGLKRDDPVYFEQNKIGKVTKVFYTKQGNYLADISITPDFLNAVTVDSKFFIDNDPRDEQGKAVVIVQEKPGGKALDRNTIVQGSIRSGFLNDIINDFIHNATGAEYDLKEAMKLLEESLNATSHKMGREMTDTLDDISRQLHTFSEEIRKVPDSKEVKQLQESIKKFTDEFNKAQKNVRSHIRDEIIPQLRKELDHLREQLHQEGRDEELEKIDRHVKEMSTYARN